tara:strand:+ start:97 stop:537 length:441 start_codon:yes stop_codon:yes gene_type:complete
MKLKISIIVIGLFTCASMLFGQERELMPVAEIRQVIKLAIDLPELQQYYHIEQGSSRTPLIINEYGLINSQNMAGIKKFGKEIVILNESEINEKRIKNYLHIGDWTYGCNTLRLQLSYVIEGILVNYRFAQKDGKWIIENSLIIEE